MFCEILGRPNWGEKQMEVWIGFIAASVVPVSAAEQVSILESLLLATYQRPWLWGVYVFAIGLPVILFVSFMWPDKRFGPPDQQYYYKKSDCLLLDDPEISQKKQARHGETDTILARRRDIRAKQSN
ncbi:calmegin-like isoform X2 [Syngnathoides biaculeatus]|uniref:calmegin-like isoform X2 n=1 Tax=Syngnathoides biaculeatus TaxID=300417 RepID=UPI002ADE786C|nr:calmegin-like isoform X2 [Syngnathoides biaculeatus]